MSVVLRADPGYRVKLHSFKLAAYTDDFVSDPVISAMSILDARGRRFQMSNVGVSKSASSVYQFTPAFEDQEVTINVDVSNLNRRAWDRIALDDITFSQVVPEPSSALLLGVSALGLLSRRSRK